MFQILASPSPLLETRSLVATTVLPWTFYLFCFHICFKVTVLCILHLLRSRRLYSSLHFHRSNMPRCFCKSHGCSSAGGMDPISHKLKGKNVDPQTFKAHSAAQTYCAYRGKLHLLILTRWLTWTYISWQLGKEFFPDCFAPFHGSPRQNFCAWGSSSICAFFLSLPIPNYKLSGFFHGTSCYCKRNTQKKA